MKNEIMPEVFISYSRRNKDFVEQLYTTLETKGHDAWVDWDNIPLTAEWWGEICKGIEASDNFIFVLTDDSLSSAVCQLEIAHAIQFNKRIIPLLYLEVDEDEVFKKLSEAQPGDYVGELLARRDLVQMSRENWLILSGLNWIFFDKPEEFESSLDNLITALGIDLDHVAQHTQYLIRALNWQGRQKRPGYLLTAQEVVEAKKWLKTNSDKEPYITSLHREYIETSAKALHRQRLRSRSTLAGVSLVVLLSSAVFIAIFGADIFAPITEMTGIFNVAVAEFSELRNGQLMDSQDGLFLSNRVYEELLESVQQAELEDVLDTRHEGIRFIPGDTPDQRAKAAADLADRLHADVVIYGTINTSSVPAQFQPEFYVSPRLTGAEELTGESAFGESLEVRLPLAISPENRTLLLDTVTPRFEALIQFLLGLAYIKVDNTDLALHQFGEARNVQGWQDDAGKEVLYLWIGTAYNGSPFEEYDCLLSDNEVDFGVFCAETAYNYALELNPIFARAHIGIGNVWMQQAKPPILDDFIDCTAYDLAAQAYQRALDLANGEAAGDTLVEIKAYGSIGWAYGEAFRNGCGEDYYNRSITAFNEALATYNQFKNWQPADQEGARIYYLQGLIHSSAENFDTALTDFESAVDIAEPEQDAEVWQDLRFNSILQIGKIHALTAPQTAADKFAIIIKAYENQIYHNQIVIGDAYYQAGLALETLGDREAAAGYFQAAIALPGTDAFTRQQAQNRLG